MLRDFISPSVRFSLRETTAQLRENLNRARLWQWQITSLQPRDGSPYSLLYIGRKSQRELAKALLGIDREMGSNPTLDLSSTVIISEMPLPGALRVPQAMHFVIPLGRSIEEIMSGFESELRRRLRKWIGRYKLQQVVDGSNIDRIDREMLQPYAKARHGSGASQFDSAELKRIALQTGRLELVLLGDEVVACQTGLASTREGKRYWVSIRFGYPEAIFSDTKRLGETNAVNFYLALAWALSNGFDYYHMGSCLARPEDDLLQWKKRWGGALYTTGNHGYFHVRLPKTGVAQFLWDSPLFSVDQNNTALHLGLSDGMSDEEAVARYRKMGFGGLSKVYLHCARPPGKRLLESLMGLYSNQKTPPILECIE